MEMASNTADVTQTQTTGYFRLRNKRNSPGPANYSFQFGPTNSTPIVGDWNGDGVDTIGVYIDANAVFRLRNSNSAGATDIIFIFGNPYMDVITGDWNGDGIDTIGSSDICTSYFRLRNVNSFRPAALRIPVRPGWQRSDLRRLGFRWR